MIHCKRPMDAGMCQINSSVHKPNGLSRYQYIGIVKNPPSGQLWGMGGSHPLQLTVIKV